MTAQHVIYPRISRTYSNFWTIKGIIALFVHILGVGLKKKFEEDARTFLSIWNELHMDTQQNVLGTTIKDNIKIQRPQTDGKKNSL